MVETVENNNSEKVPVKAKNEDRILVSHGTGVYDVTSFAEIHPGGREYLTRFKNKVMIRKKITDHLTLRLVLLALYKFWTIIFC